jgi:hypothetical protein
VIAPAVSRRRGRIGEAVVAWVVARLLVAVSYAVAESVGSVLHVRGLRHLHEGLVTWDGSSYWLIAHEGYDAVSRDGLRFFPLYPLVSRLLAWPIGRHDAVTLLVVTNVAALVAMVLLGRLVEEETEDVDLARRSVWILALFPAAAAMVLADAVPLLLVASLAMFLWMRRDHWWWVAGAGLLAGLTRPTAVLLVVPVAIEAVVTARRHDSFVGRRVSVAGRLAAVASPIVGALIYLFWVGGQFGDWLAPVSAQRRARGGFQDPFTRLYDGVHLMLTKSQLDAPNVLAALGLVVLLVVAIRTQRVSWWAYALVTLLVALSARDLASIGREGLVAFPFTVALARLGEDERAMWAIVTLSAAALVAFTTMSALGTFTP